MTFGGRLTLVSGKPVMDADVIGATTLYYAPDTGNTANGITFTSGPTDEIGPSLSLAGLTPNSIHKVFLDPCGALYLGSPPDEGETRDYGSGLYSGGIYIGAAAHDPNPPVSRYNGVQGNSAGDPWLGTILIDPAGGACTCHVTQGGKRRWGVWNRYNQRPIILKAGVDGLGSYTPSATMPAWGPVHNNADNCLTFVSGEPQQVEAALLTTRGIKAGTGSVSNEGHYQSAIGLNRTDAPDGQLAGETFEVGALTVSILNSSSGIAPYVSPPIIGANTLYALENYRDTAVVYGGNIQTMLWARFMG